MLAPVLLQCALMTVLHDNVGLEIVAVRSNHLQRLHLIRHCHHPIHSHLRQRERASADTLHEVTDMHVEVMLLRGRTCLLGALYPTKYLCLMTWFPTNTLQVLRGLWAQSASTRWLETPLRGHEGGCNGDQDIPGNMTGHYWLSCEMLACNWKTAALTHHIGMCTGQADHGFSRCLRICSVPSTLMGNDLHSHVRPLPAT